MMALMVLMFFVIYLAISLGVIFVVLNWTDKNKRSKWWAVLAAFVMYNLVFWDLIPTRIMHKHYCDTQAGFTIYKTPEQWKAENPDLTAEDLKPLGKNKEMLWDFPRMSLKRNPKKNVKMINQRIYLDSDYEENFLSLIPISKLTRFIADNRNDQRLAQLVTFGSGYGGMMTSQDWRAMKFWLSRNCSGTDVDEELATGYKKFLKRIIELGE